MECRYFTSSLHLHLLMRHRFRWVTCQLDALENCLDYPTLQKALNSLPMTLDETYARILTNLPHEHEHHTRRLLQFLTFSERPLTIKEAVDAIAVDTDNKPRFDPKNRMPVPEEIVSYCSSLVVLTVRALKEREFHQLMGYYPDFAYGETEETIQELQLAHLSVKDYLLSERVPQGFAKDFNEATARASIAQVCLAYLLELEEILRVEEFRQSYWLAQYSAQYWMDHAVVVESGSKQVCALIAEFLSCGVAWTNCYRLYDPDRAWDPFIIYDTPSASALYYASLGGSCFSVRLLLDMGADVNSRQGRYDSALNAAVHQGHVKVIQILLDKNADINIASGEYLDALQAASGGGYDKIVQMLLNNGAGLHAQGGSFGTALVAASYHGHDKTVQLLLKNNADINAQGGNYPNALYAASCRGHDKVVQILFDNNANVNAHNASRYTALHEASGAGYDKVVRILLKNGADINAQDGVYRSALQAAADGGHDNTVQILLDEGADVDAQGGRDDPNALYAASSRGYDKIVQMLLNKGANVNANGGFYGTALYAAAEKGHDKMVQMLLNNGANVNAKCGFWGTALYAAAEGGYDKIVQMLLDKGADVNVRGGPAASALGVASAVGHHKITQMLLDRGANVDPRNIDFVSKDHPKIAQMLRDRISSTISEETD